MNSIGKLYPLCARSQEPISSDASDLPIRASMISLCGYVDWVAVLTQLDSLLLEDVPARLAISRALNGLLSTQ